MGQSLETLQEESAALQDEIDLQNVSLDQLTHLSNVLTSRQANQINQVAKLEQELAKMESGVRGKQEKVMEAGAKWNKQVEELANKAKEIIEVAKGFKGQTETKW